MEERCAALDCHSDADRTVVWTDGVSLIDYSHECRLHAIESATVVGAFHAARPDIRVAAVFAGVRELNRKPGRW